MNRFAGGPVEGVRSFRRLEGLSGAMVYVYTRDGRRWQVRKLAADPATSPRLRRQAQKQREFGDLDLSAVAVPRVIDEGEYEGRYWFDMEHIRGEDAVTHLSRAGYPAIERFADSIEALLDGLAEPVDPQCNVDPFASLYSKVMQVHEQVGGLDAALLGQIIMSLEPVRRLGTLPMTRCHGDLTLENLIVDPHGTVWLIDLLDSPIEHYWQDISKLHQDLTGGWYRRRSEAIPRSVLQYLSDRIWSYALAKDEGYGLAHQAMLVCTFLRILPYIGNDEGRRFVRDRLLFLLRLPPSEATQ